MARPGGAQGDVDQARAIPDQVFDRFVGGEELLQQFGAAVEDLAKNDGGELAVLKRLRGGRQIGPVGGWIEESTVGAQEAAAAADRPTLAPRVSTSNPESVTNIVCSHWADSD